MPEHNTQTPPITPESNITPETLKQSLPFTTKVHQKLLEDSQTRCRQSHHIFTLFFRTSNMINRCAQTALRDAQSRHSAFINAAHQEAMTSARENLHKCQKQTDDEQKLEQCTTDFRQNINDIAVAIQQAKSQRLQAQDLTNLPAASLGPQFLPALLRQFTHNLLNCASAQSQKKCEDTARFHAKNQFEQGLSVLENTKPKDEETKNLRDRRPDILSSITGAPRSSFQESYGGKVAANLSIPSLFT